MACPTCDHTMDRVCDGPCQGIFHCPRCGTLKTDSDVYAPKLVGRCRNFGAFLASGTARELWVREGIAESINVPGERSE